MACILVRWRNAASEAAYANCPLDDPFMSPEIAAMLIMLVVKDEVMDLERRGRKPAETKNWEATFVSKVKAQVTGSDFQRCSEMA